MRHLIVCLFLLGLMPVIVQGQCTADAGNNAVVCVGMFGVDTTQIGGNPTATGGIGSYTYTWEASITIGAFTLTASDFLDDTTLANPQIINSMPEDLVLHLTVVDSAGNICTDSIAIRFSQFGITLFDKSATINQGDSVQLYSGVGGGIQPLTFAWTPGNDLSDSTITDPFASPDTTTYYVNMVTDSAGCQITDPDVFEVYVTPVGVDEKEINGLDITIYPNPTTGLITIVKLPSETTEIGVYNILGALVFKAQPAKQQIDISRLPKGTYMIHVAQGKTAIHRRIIKL